MIRFLQSLTLTAIFAAISLSINAQGLPQHITSEEKAQMNEYLLKLTPKGYTTPPASKVRTMAEWEEIQTLLISWEGYESILSKIVDAAQHECRILISCSDSNYVKSKLINNGVSISNNVKYLKTPTNSIWCRDYSANSVYTNDVDSLLLVDWVYNRPRPDDDNNPVAVAAYHGYPLYQTINVPWKLVNTGGNFMSDGLGTAFAEELILDDNPSLTESQIDTIIKKFMGISRYIKVTNLPDDGIHHIDMHMKIIDEETLLVGQFPPTVPDGQQIEANLLYILNNYNSVYGTPYKIVRIPMPPSQSGNYPPNAYYRTYTNGVFVNKTYIYPTYYEEYDTTAHRILKENLIGYNIVGINCQNIISQSGAIHCITHSVGSNEPVLIYHQALTDTYNTSSDYEVKAVIKTKAGINNAKVFYRTDTLQVYQIANMSLTNPSNDTWTGYIPVQTGGQTVYYYINAASNSGKQQNRPITAPDGFWKFNVTEITNIQPDLINIKTGINEVFPVPANAITCVVIHSSAETVGTLTLSDIYGKTKETIHEGRIVKGESMYFFDASKQRPGVYFLSLNTTTGRSFKKLIIQ